MSLFTGRKPLLASAAIVPSVPAAALPAAVPAAPQPAATLLPAQVPTAAKPKRGKKKDKDDDDKEDDEDPDDEKDEDGDDDTDDEENRRGSGSKAYRARRRERARIAAILGHSAAAQNGEFAAHLALSTDLGRTAAIAMLDKAPKGASPSDLASRMQSVAGMAAPPNAVQPTEKERAAAGWDDVFAKHAVTKR